MDINRLDGEMQAAYQRIPSFTVNNALVRYWLRFKERRQKVVLPAVSGLSIRDVQHKHITLRLYEPQQRSSQGAVLWAHGGGYLFGSLAMTDLQCIQIAKKLGVLVVSVDYRLAPKHPFPAAHNDCRDAWQYLVANAAEWAIDPQLIALVGQSAGGGLMAGLALRLLDSHQPLPVAQVLIYPMLDDRTGANRDFDRERHFLWNNPSNRAAWGWYLNQKAGSDSVPDYAVPARHAQVAGLPPTWIGIGELDLFYDEDCRYAQKLKDAGVECELLTIPGAPHGFDVIAYGAAASKRWVDSYLGFLASKLA